MSRKFKKLALMFLVAMLVMPIGVLSVVAEGETEKQPVYHETFEHGIGVATQAGNAQLEAVTDVIFAGNDAGNAIYVSGRMNNWDGVDIPLSEVGMENGQEYTITVTGFVAEGESVSEGAQLLLQNVDSYNGLYVAADFVAGEAFTLTGRYTVHTEEDRALRIQSNEAGKEVPFYIGDLLITKEVSSDEDSNEEPEPDTSRPPAQEFTTITFEDGSTGGFEGRAGTEQLVVTDEANHTEGGSYSLKVEGRTNTWHGPSLNVAPYVDKGEEYHISLWVKLISPETSQLQLSTKSDKAIVQVITISKAKQ
ncbi:carbohydrate binding domain-containing protein [Bacillus sp. JCM 19034]|uniref:carbohydrate binding domain-containing protein n=1 Tax=Bacillus sp. JCM 19034 TaxID=1481928 RepID=UPI000A9B8031